MKIPGSLHEQGLYVILNSFGLLGLISLPHAHQVPPAMRRSVATGCGSRKLEYPHHMPAALLRSKLRAALDGRTVCQALHGTDKADDTGRRIEGVGPLQLHHILDGTTAPWLVRVRTAQLLCELFPHHIQITDFYKGR